MDGRGMTEAKLDRYRSTAVFFVMFAVIIVTAIATLAVGLRAALNSGGVSDPQQVQSYGLNDDTVQLFQVDGAKNYEFVIAYLVEMALNYFFYYPLVGTLLFSGILTCGQFPVVGGRPYELREETELAALGEGFEVTLGNAGNNNSNSNKTKSAAKFINDVEQPARPRGSTTKK